LEEETLVKKENVLDEIRTTVRFLLKEREKGREQFNDQDFLDADLERNILYNFDGIISRKEYEEVILEFFGKEVIKEGKLPVNEIEKETEVLMLKYRIRTKELLVNRIAGAMTENPEEWDRIKTIIENKYTTVMENLAQKRINDLMYSAEIKQKTLKSILEREGISVPDNFLSELMLKRINHLKRRQRVKAPESSVNVVRRERLFQQRRAAPQKAPVSAGQSMVRKRYMKAFQKKGMLRKKDFLETNCLSFKFALDKNYTEDGQRIFIHSSKFKGTNISVKSISEESKIANVLITFTNPDSKNKEFILDLHSVIELINSDLNAEVQKILKVVNTIMEFPNFQELLWFLSHILSERCKLPLRTSEFLQKKFLTYVKNLDATISKYIIEKALSKGK